MTPHRTAGAGGFVDITARARRIVFSGTFNAGAKMSVDAGKVRIDQEGRIAKIVPVVDQISFSGTRAVETGQEVTSVTERCVLKLTPEGLILSEIAPGIDIRKDVLDQARAPLKVSDELRVMDTSLFRPEPIGLRPKQAHPLSH